MKKMILDACCGSRMFWFDRQNENTVFMDNRTLKTTLCDGRKLIIDPDVVGDFRKMPFPDGEFRLVVFDPPHLVKGGEKSWLVQKYGRLCPETWKDDLRAGFTKSVEEQEFNAVLISAAPEMYEALLWTCSKCNSDSCKDCPVEKALKKARGEK